MSKPALYTVSAFDATKDYTFRFRYIGVITKVEAQIWANAMSAEELGSPTYQSGEVSTQRSEFTLKASSITNSSAAFGIKVRVCGQDSAWSEWSDILLFYCVETPVFKFKEISTKDKTNIEYADKTIMPAGTFTLGDSYAGSDWNTNFHGKLSDFRIYATALSDEDIAELYNTPVSITSTGTMMTKGELIET